MSDECRFECLYECVCAREQVLEIEFYVESAFVAVVVVIVAGVVCSASCVACLLLVYFSSLFRVFGKGARDFVNLELCFLWICLFAGSRSCGSWSSQQHPSREARIETGTEIGTGIGIWDCTQIGRVRLCLSSLPGGFYAFAVIK